VAPDLPEVGESLIAAYGGRTRIYHDLRHLRQLLATLDLLADGRPPLTVELAGWFHDAVYDVGGGDNESASARLATESLSDLLDTDDLREVQRLVELTRHHAVESFDEHGALLCDADLVVLAGDPATYAEYVRRVRREYAHLDDESFRAGRAGALRGLLALPALFHTPHGRLRWEGPARANLEAELDTLTRPATSGGSSQQS
jgi:predicted metal-dependent HD superfamily phosphohydrolase